MPQHNDIPKSVRPVAENNRTKPQATWEDKLIADATYTGNYLFKIQFRGGTCKKVNIRPYLEKYRELFAPLLNHPDRVNKFKWDCIELYWNDLMGIESQTLYDMGEKFRC